MANSITTGTTAIGTVNNATLGDALSNFSLSMWVKTSSTSSASCFLSCKGNPAGSVGWYIFVVPTTHQIALGVNGGTIQDNGTINFYDGAWHNLIVAYDASAGTTGYLDGSPITFSSGNALPTTTTDHFQMGATGQNDLDGQWYDIRFFNVTLSSGDAASIVAGHNPQSVNLQAEWPITEGSGTSFTDLTGNGNTIVYATSPTPFSSTDIPPVFSALALNVSDVLSESDSISFTGSVNKTLSETQASADALTKAPTKALDESTLTVEDAEGQIVATEKKDEVTMGSWISLDNKSYNIWRS